MVGRGGKGRKRGGCASGVYLAVLGLPEAALVLDSPVMSWESRQVIWSGTPLHTPRLWRKKGVKTQRQSCGVCIACSVCDMCVHVLCATHVVCVICGVRRHMVCAGMQCAAAHVRCEHL